MATAAEDVLQVQTFLDDRMAKLVAPATAAEWQTYAAETRAAVRQLLLSGHPAGLAEAAPTVRWGDVIETGGGYRIRKLVYEGYPGLWVPALVYEPDALTGKVPAVLNPDGHSPAGIAALDKQPRCINIAKRGMIALSYEFVGMGQLGTGDWHTRVSQLEVCGLYGVGIFYLVMKRALDILLSLDHVDPMRVAMTGCSGGGWQTSLLSAVDTRITVSVPVAGHSPVWQRIHHDADLGDQEQVPGDLARIADYDVLTALIAPRPCLLIYNHYDTCCFQSERARVSIYERVKPVYELLGCPERLVFHDCLYPRSHNYDAGNREQLYRFLERHFGLPDSGPDIPCEDEYLSEPELFCDIPPDNATLLTLARDALVDCRRHRRTHPGDRQRLAALLRLPDLAVDQVAGDVAVIGTWRVNRREWDTTGATATLLLLDERGLEAGPADLTADGAAAKGQRVVGAEPWGTVDCRGTWKYHLALACAGYPSLGIQVAQVLALGRWLATRYPGQPLHLHAGTLTLPVVAVIAAALAPELWASVTVLGLMPSLDRIVDWPIDHADCPALFCPGLLREFDLPAIVALAAPVPIHAPNRGLLRARRV